MRIEDSEVKGPKKLMQIVDIRNSSIAETRKQRKLVERANGIALALSEHCEDGGGEGRDEQGQLFQDCGLRIADCGFEIYPQSAFRNPPSIQGPKVKQEHHARQSHQHRLG